MASPEITPVPLIHVDLRDTIGALEITSLVGVFLFGIVTVQSYFYFTTYTKDPWWNKLLVASVWLLEFGTTFYVSLEVYSITILLYGRPETLNHFPFLLPFLCFYSVRILRLLPKPYNFIGVLTVVVATLRLVGSYFIVEKAVSEPSIQKYDADWGWFVVILFVAGAVIDVIIAFAMMFYFLNQRSKGLGRVSKLIDRLIAFTVGTGFLTSIFAVTVVIMLKMMENNLVWMGLYTLLAKLYSNSLLSSLNSRKAMRDELTSSTDAVISYDRYGQPRQQQHTHDSTIRRNDLPQFYSEPISIEMKTTREYMADDDMPLSVSPSIVSKKARGVAGGQVR